MVKRGTTLLKGVNVEITKLETPYPTVSDKDGADLGVKIRYLADVLEQVRDNTSAGGTTDIVKWGGTSVTGRDITGDIAKLQNLDVALSDIDAKIRAQSSFSHGQITVGTTATQLPSATAVKGVVIKAHKSNTGNIYVGNSSSVSTTTGFELAAGEAIVIEVNDASLIWVVADADGQKVSWIAV